MELTRHADKLGDYTELRLQQNTMRRVQLVNGAVLANTSSTRRGVSARVWRDGVWGFASDVDAADAGVDRVLKAARDNAAMLGARTDRAGTPLPRTSHRSTNRFATDQKRWSSAELLEYLQELDGWIASTWPELMSREVGLLSLDMDKHLITSESAHSDSMIPRTNLYIRLAIEVGGEPVQLRDVHGGFGQLEDQFDQPDALHASIRKQAEHLKRKTEAVYAQAGEREVVLDADLAGILAHEAIGHTTEGDLVLGGSVAGNLVDQKVASELVSLSDFAHTAFGERLPVPVYVDDEGTEARDVHIITDGVLNGFMHSKETAQRLGAQPTGNARAFEFNDEPLVRMRNTSFLPGDSKLDDMIASVDDGYYLMRSSNGQADSTSEFMFGIVLGYEIKNGKLGRAIRDTTISGVAFDVLETVTQVSDDVNWQSAGMCGKKQPIPVGMGGPAIRCRLNLGGQ